MYRAFLRAYSPIAQANLRITVPMGVPASGSLEDAQQHHRKMTSLGRSPDSTQLPATVPMSFLASDEQIDQLDVFIRSKKKLLVVTGAGVSTEAGVPDYRSPNIGLYYKNHKPTVISEFLQPDGLLRQRYWARNYMAWPKFSTVKPGDNHRILARWELEHRLHFLITQNVDRLHLSAGSTRFVELHGNTQTVRCMSCNALYSRDSIQEKLMTANQHWSAQISSVGETPDGDVDLITNYLDFKEPRCTKCSGILKPDVVFFGESVPADLVAFCRHLVSISDGMLVLGSSMQTYSAFRLAKQMESEGKPIALVSVGDSRIAAMTSLTIDSRIGDVLTRLK